MLARSALRGTDTIVTKVPNDGAMEQRTWLVFALGPYVMCASAIDVEGIIQCPGAIAKLPLTPDHVLGAFLFRERSAAAISLRKKLKLREGEDRATGPFIVARVCDSLVAFCVDEVRDVIEEKDAEWRAMPSLLDGGLFDRLGTRDGQLVLQTSFAALRDAEVQFESFARLLACTEAGPANATPEAPGDLSGTVRLPDAASTVEPAPAPESVPTKETKDERNESRRPPASAASGIALRAQRAEARAAGAGRKTGPARNGALGNVKLGVRADSRAVASLPPQPRRDEPPARPGQMPVSEAAIAPITAVSPRAEAAGVRGAETRNGTKPVWVAAVVAITALAAILYALLSTSSRHGAPISPASAVPSPGQSIAPAVLPAHDPDPTPIVPAKPVSVVLALPAAPGDAESMREYTVVRGDTLWRIAKKHVGNPFQYPELARLSHISNPDLIHPGDIVRIEIRKEK